MRICMALLVLSLVAWLPVRAATAYTVTLNSGSYLTAEARDQSANGVSDDRYPSALPYSYTSLGVDGGAFSESEYGLYNAGFSITFDHSRTSTYGAFARSLGSIYFSVSEDINYSAEGLYYQVDPDGRRIFLVARLYDDTLGSYVFDNYQESRWASANESFTLGLAEGDYANTNIGSLTGTLIAGHEYWLYYGAQIEAYPPTTSSATASGFVSLTFTPIPEPGTGLFVGMGLVALTVSRRCSRARA